MNDIKHIGLILFTCLCLFIDLSAQNEKPIITQPDSTYNVPLEDSTCFRQFYKISDSFLDESTWRISERTRNFYFDCCLYLIREGDSLAQDILFNRTVAHLRKYLEGDSLYFISTSIIFYSILSEIPDYKTIDIAMVLFQKDACSSNGIEVGVLNHQGLGILNAMLRILNKDKATEYYKELHSLRNDALKLGYNDYDCTLDTFVYKSIREKVIHEYKTGQLHPRAWSDMPKLTRHDEPIMMRHNRESAERGEPRKW